MSLPQELPSVCPLDRLHGSSLSKQSIGVRSASMTRRGKTSLFGQGHQMTLSQLGWNSVFETSWSGSDRGAHFPARVTEVQKNAWRLLSTNSDFLATISGRLRHK